MKRICVTGLVTVLATAFLAVVAPGTASAADRDCSDFATQRAAQIFYLNHGGPQADPDGLDRDGDGVACDSNPCPCYHGSHVPGVAPAVHRRVVHSRVGLRVAPVARIVGEPRAVVVTVAPRRSRYVRIQQVRAGRWSTVAHGRTTRDGRLRLSLRAPASRATSYRAVVPSQRAGRTLYTAARSSARRIVRQLQHVSLTLPASVDAGRSATARVRVTPVRVGRPVLLQREIDGSWHDAGNLKRESTTGRASFTVPTSAAGSVRLRAVVRARNGAPAAASPAGVLTVADVTAPGYPTGVTATAGDGEVFLTWDASTAPDFDHYRVYVATASTPLTEARVHPGDTNQATVTGLTNGTLYYFTVTATDTAGNQSTMSASADATPEATADTTPPAVPTGLSGQLGLGSATLSWTAVGDSDLAHYNVYIGTSSGVLTLADQQPGSATTDTVSGLDNGTTYYFAVTAVDGSLNESARSDEVTVVPGCPVGIGTSRLGAPAARGC